MAILKFLWTALIGGVVVILPVALMAAGVVTAVGMIRDFLAPIAGGLPSTINHPTWTAAGLVVLLCFAAGLLVRTAIGRAWKEAMDRRVLERIPGYSLFRALSRRMGGENESAMAAALVRLDDHELIGFIMERLSDGRCAVFVPSAPTPAVGSLIVVPADRVTPLQAQMSHVLGCISKWGDGAGALLGNPAATDILTSVRSNLSTAGPQHPSTSEPMNLGTPEPPNLRTPAPHPGPWEP